MYLLYVVKKTHVSLGFYKIGHVESFWWMSWDDIIDDFQAIVFLKIGVLQSIIVFSMLTKVEFWGTLLNLTA